jgi:hypothetical protein
MSSFGPAEHRKLAIDANNSTWEFLDREPASLTAHEIEEMMRRAYAAAGDLALSVSDRCIELCLANNVKDFDLAYVYEAKARSLACLGDGDGARAAKNFALSVEVADDEDRKLVQADMAKGPWFGLN